MPPPASQLLLEVIKKLLGVIPNIFRLVAKSSGALEGYLRLSGALGKATLSVATGKAPPWPLGLNGTE
jgi:hypothetical protein